MSKCRDKVKERENKQTPTSNLNRVTVIGSETTKTRTRDVKLWKMLDIRQRTVIPERGETNKVSRPCSLYGLRRTFCTMVQGEKEKTMAPLSSTLAWKIPRMEEPGRLQSMESLRVGYD